MGDNVYNIRDSDGELQVILARAVATSATGVSDELAPTDGSPIVVGTYVPELLFAQLNIQLANTTARCLTKVPACAPTKISWARTFK